MRSLRWTTKTYLGLCILLIVVIAGPTAADMSSENYRITTTVISGGGGPMTSASYQMNGTVGQPSPLVDPTFPPQSANYDLLAGFWYTLGSAPSFSACPADLNTDGDVDDVDLALLATGFGQSGLSKDADEDGDMDGRDLYEMVIDFGRADCMD